MRRVELIWIKPLAIDLEPRRRTSRIVARDSMMTPIYSREFAHWLDIENDPRRRRVEWFWAMAKRLR
jgi:hypothetical protein